MPTVKEQLAEALGRIEQLEGKQSEVVQIAALAGSVDRLGGQIERLMQMVCPHCGPKIIDEMHPEVKREAVAVAADIVRDGRHARNGHSG